MLRWKALVCAISVILVAGAACGGSNKADTSPSAGATSAAEGGTPADGNAQSNPTTSSASGSQVTPASGGSEDVALTTDPGRATVTVDGETLTYESAGSIYYTCNIESDTIQINYQTPEGHDFLIRGSLQSGGWVGQITFTKGGGANDRYQAAAPGDGELTVSGDAASYTGAVQHMEGFDLNTAQDVDATIAVNCATAGGDPQAEIDGQTYVFPASGAQSFDCEISEDAFRVVINRLATDDLQLSLEAKRTAGDWLGNVTVISGDDNYVSVITGAGEGLDISGSTIAYSGTFDHTKNRQPEGKVEGSATATCP